MRKKILQTLGVILAAAALVVGGSYLCDRMDAWIIQQAWKKQLIAEYPIPNAHISWTGYTGAGYPGWRP